MNTATRNYTGAYARRYSNESTAGEGSFWQTLDLSGMFKSLTEMVTGIFGKGDKYVANMYSKMYEEQKKTTTVLWVVIGLVVALGVYLVIRKTK